MQEFPVHIYRFNEKFTAGADGTAPYDRRVGLSLLNYEIKLMEKFIKFIVSAVWESWMMLMTRCYQL